MLSDGDQIRNLLGSYCELIDNADYDAVGALFDDDAVLTGEDGTVVARGPAEIAANYRNLIKLHDGAQRTKHLVTNTALSETADSEITARSSFVVFQATDALTLQPIMAGRYVDRFRHHLDRWHWIERTFTVDLVGHLSEHLGKL